MGLQWAPLVGWEESVGKGGEGCGMGSGSGSFWARGFLQALIRINLNHTLRHVDKCLEVDNGK